MEIDENYDGKNGRIGKIDGFMGHDGKHHGKVFGFVGNHGTSMEKSLGLWEIMEQVWKNIWKTWGKVVKFRSLLMVNLGRHDGKSVGFMGNDGHMMLLDDFIQPLIYSVF